MPGGLWGRDIELFLEVVDFVSQVHLLPGDSVEICTLVLCESFFVVSYVDFVVVCCKRH